MIKSVDDAYVVLRKIGLDTTQLTKVEPIQKRHGNRLLRITHGSSSYILKVFGNPDASTEVQAYALLKDLGVPTLHTIATTSDALLLEDLEVSNHLRLAGEDDVGKAGVGVAIAAWYRALHHAGSRFSTDQTKPTFLRREIEEVTPASILDVASRVGGADHSKWANLADNIDRIKNAAMALEETLTYNDFHWTNLALSRNEKPIRAVMFDYHLLGVGLRYSDCRNVTYSLGSDAAGAFWSAYGDTDPREKIFDDLLAPLHALVEAFRRPKFPSWGEESLELAKTGKIHSRIDQVMEIL